MPFVRLASRLPELARNETRSLHQFDDGEEIRAHLFDEMYCDERGCDCRRVVFHVVSDDPSAPQPRAMLSWGWEPDAFYRAWARFPLTDADLDELRGPGLMRLTEQSEDAEELLEQLRTILKDEAYRARIQRHYAAFRATVDDGDAPEPGLNRAERRRLARAARRR